MLVELLPVEAWLLVFAAYEGLPVDQAAAPFWALLAAMALAWEIARRTRGDGQRAALSVGVVPFLLAFLLLLRVSPAAYGDTASGPFDLSWLGTLANDFATNSPRVSALFGLLILLALIWWRGTALGADPESNSGNLRRFTLFMGGLLLALVGAVAAKPEAQDALSAALTLVLLGEVFAGLLDAALARIATARREGVGGSNEAPWVRTSLGLAAAVIGVALLVSVVFNFDSFLALLAYLGPVGGVISFVLTALINGFAALLGKLLTPIIVPFHGKLQVPHLAPLVPLQKGCHVVNGAQVCPNHNASNAILDFVAHLLIILAVLVIIALIAYVTRVTISKRHGPDTGTDEEREALDAQKLFAAQLRGLLSRRGRRPRSDEEALPRGSVRYLYREVLRAAQASGLNRRPDETPDEYAGRLGRTAPLAMFSTGEGTDLLALNDAYDDARYAGREPEPSRRERLQAGAARLTRLFRGQDRGRR